MEFLKSCKQPALAALFAVFLLVAFPNSASAQMGRLQLYEETIKTGLIYNFLKYTAWPDSAKSKNDLQVCLFGGDPLNGNLNLLQGKTAQQSVIKILSIDDVDQTTDCNLLFVNRNSQHELPAILSATKNRHILTVSDIDEFASLGGMIEMTMEDQHVTLYVNKKALDSSGLNIQDRLLKLAKLVSR